MPNHQRVADSKSSTSEDEISAELDEPPDARIHFSRVSPFTKSLVPKQHAVPSHVMDGRKASLLTQGLLTSPHLTPSSDGEAPCLTSDGGLTSPARTNSPSPPLPTSHPRGLPAILPHGAVSTDAKTNQKHPALASTSDINNNSFATDVELGLGRKRCIRFACGRQAVAQQEDSHIGKASPTNDGVLKAENPSKRPCMLRFVCPSKPSPRSSGKQQQSKDAADENQANRSSSTTKSPPFPPCAQSWQYHDSESSVALQGPDANCIESSQTFNPQDLEGSEATRFHEFAGPYNGEDEWVNEQIVHRKKITVNDTLQKENAIRKLGEEAEEEAMEEETAEEEEHYDGLAELDDRLSSDDGASDGGNESDNEEGFAESDDESETGSDYHFWTPGLTTAATSADHLEHFRPTVPRTSSSSSVESMIHVQKVKDVSEHAARRVRKSSRTRPLRMRPGTPDLPDSTDFVCGTLDEDRPLEAAYLSCLEERRRSKHPVVPQDIDPSFPTSDSEDDEDASDDAGKGASMTASDEPQWVTGQPDNSDEEHILPLRKPLSRRNTKSPMPSPKRMRSPPPQKRNVLRRCPIPRTTPSSSCEQSSSSSLSASADQSQPLMQKPPPVIQTLTNPQEVAMPRLPRRSTVTHTASLPRTPNPFWAPSGQWCQLSSAASPQSKAADMRSRGPIDIVTGLEKKRQRRKEKFWRQHYRSGGRDKERRCQPGKGAERMRELGLEIAGKNKGQLPHVQLMLSI
ncbi:MAG: hypothetical protein LQ343_007290 [Gyalolechia ehrenbergii]|nr:MAG: hypothetical protein LQ343_007290 [Gyalolechia ehrenbergii]